MKNRYQLQLPPALQRSPFSVLEFTLTEALDVPYRLHLGATSADDNLPLARYIDQPVKFSVAPDGVHARQLTDEAVTRVWHGVIRSAGREHCRGEETLYRFEVAPRLDRLADFTHSRLFVRQTIPQIVEALLRHHGQTGVDFAFHLTQTPERHDLITQYQESDLAFIRRLLADEGIWFTFVQGKYSERIVFADNLEHYVRRLNHVPLRETAGLESAEREAVTRLSIHHQTMRQTTRIKNYNELDAGNDLLCEAGSAAVPPSAVGVDYRWGERHATRSAGDVIARRRQELSFSRQCQAEGGGNVLAMRPGEVVRLDQRFKDAPHGWLITGVRHQGGRGQSYANHFNAVPAERVWRPALQPRPTISGTLPARISSPADAPYAGVDELGRYRVRPDFARAPLAPGDDCLRVRLARPSAGAYYGQHFPLLDGTEVQLAFVGGDPDRPYIFRVLHDSLHADPVNNANLTHNLIRSAGNNQLRMEDLKDREHIQLATEYHSTQLNLGHLVDSQGKARGAGFELRSDGWGALRAGKGLLLSAHARGPATGRQRDMDPSIGQLQQANRMTEALSQAAGKAGAEPADLYALKQLLAERISDLRQSILLASAPAGMALTTAEHLQLSAGQSLSGDARQNINFSALKNFVLVAGKTISLFAQKAGIKLVAQRGKTQIAAQNDTMQLTAQQDLSLRSHNGTLSLAAQQEVLLSSGGAYVRIKDGNIEIHCPGRLSLRGNVSAGKACELFCPPPSLPRAAALGRFSQCLDLSAVMKDQPHLGFTGYHILDSGGKLIASGHLDGGCTARYFAHAPENASLVLTTGKPLQVLDPRRG